MSDGQLAINTNLTSPGLFFKDSNGDLVKVGPVHVGTTAPNVSPAVGGQAGNSKGEQWLDTTGGTYVFKVWDGTAWRSESGTFVDANGDVMTGALGVIAGTAAAPGLYVSGNTNTGIYSPGADQLAISTGGAGRVFVDASGSIGVGTASPASLLHVDNGVLNSGRYGAPGSIVLRSAAGTQASPTVISTSTNVAVVVGRGYDGTAYQDVAAIGVNSDGAISSTSSPGFISFNTTPSGSVATTERARIDSSGRLLVGTSSAITAVTFAAQVQSNSFYSYSSSLFSADANGSNFFFLKSRNATTGNHTVVQANDVLGQTQYAGSDGTAFITGAAISAAVDGTPGTNDMPGRLVFSTTADGASSPTERLRIDSSGRVGIGTTAPGDIVSVTGGNVALQSTGGAGAGDRPTERRLLRSDIGSTNGLAAIGMNGAGTNGFLGEIKFYTGSADLFNTALAERARIDQAGRLLLGTSSVYNVPTGDGAARSPGLQRVASTFADSSISSVLFNTASGGGGTLQLGRSNTTTVGTEAIAVSGDVAGSIYFSASDGAAQIRAAQIFAAVDGTPGLNDMPGRLVFSTTADGAATPTERLRIASTGAFGLSGANYGTSGQVLTSSGTGAAPTWTTISAGGGDVFLASANAFTGANTFTNATGQIFRSAATQDGILLRGRAGGTSSRTVEIVPASLTADRVLTAPNVSGTIVTTGDTGSVTSSMIADGTIVDVDINASAAIAYSKLASMTAGSVLLGNATNVPTVTALTGDVTVSSAGVTAIGSGVIVNADVNASAAIAYSKLASMTAGSVLLGNASNVPTVTALSGDVTVSNTGVTSIGTGVIVNADVSASAAIAGSKITPNFGSQDVITTGSVQGSVKADTAVTTSGAATYTFTAVPSWAKRITILFTDLSCAGADSFGIRVGTSGGIVSTGYLGAHFRVSDGGTASVFAFSTEFTMILTGSNAAASVYSGTLTLSNITGNTWVIGGTFAANTTGTNSRTGCLNGYIALAGALTQVQLVNTTSTFDAGTFNVLYEG
jgi:hypothetical protein